MKEKIDTNNGELLTPSEALNRFMPTEQFGIIGEDETAEPAHYGCRVANVGLILDTEKGSEVIDEISIGTILNTPSWFSGVINLRGNLVPVFNLKKLIPCEEEGITRQRILVIDKGFKAAGIIIDELPQALYGLHSLPQLPPVPDILSEHVRAAYAQDDNIWLDCDFEGFFKGLGQRMAA